MARSRTPRRKEQSEHRGPVLDVLRTLLEQGRQDDVLAVVGKLVARNEELEQRLARVLGRGRANEGVSSAQLKLFIDALKDETDAEEERSRELADANQRLGDAANTDDLGAQKDAPVKRRQPSMRRALPPGLPRVDNPIPVPASERPCPNCGAERTCYDHETTEVIELEPARVVVRVDRREKLACKQCDGELVRAPPGDKAVAGGRLGTRLVATVVVDKYDDGLPLHRQKQRFERLGISLPVSTLADQVTWATELLRRLWRLAVLRVLAAKVMHVDATGLPVLDRDAPGGKRLGALWGYVGDKDVAAYLYASTGKKRGQKPGELGPADMLDSREGYTVADAAGVYDESFKRPELIECGCHMHARRYFTKALDAGDARAALPLAAYKKLYDIEARVRDADPETRLATRVAESKAVWDELCVWCDTYQPHEPPTSKLGEAIRYLTNNRVALGRFLDDGVIPVDNGIVERLHVRAASWGSLCVTPSNARNPQSLRARGNATRAATSPIACA